jgi:hypothetical protein
MYCILYYRKNNFLLCEIWGSHGDEDLSCDILGHDIV